MSKLRVGIAGATGRMGRALVGMLDEHSSLELGAALVRLPHGNDADARYTTDVDSFVRASDVVVDFTSPASTASLAAVATTHRKPMVIGTTGLDAAAESSIATLAAVAPVVVAPNTSVGVAVLSHLVREARRLLGNAYDAEIIELHHRRKADAPSGTALRLARDVESTQADMRIVHGRDGRPGARKPEELGMHAVRAGDIIGEHMVLLAGEGERLELVHRAHSRDLFAQGALRAAHWIVGRSAGRYDMDQVLGI